MLVSTTLMQVNYTVKAYVTNSGHLTELYTKSSQYWTSKKTILKKHSKLKTLQKLKKKLHTATDHQNYQTLKW